MVERSLAFVGIWEILFVGGFFLFAAITAFIIWFLVGRRASCAFHLGKPAAQKCASCAKPLCPLCYFTSNSRVLCTNSFSQVKDSPPTK